MKRVDGMTAKYYLSQLQLMKSKIKQLQEQKQMYLDRATSITASFNPVKVQTSSTTDKMGDNVTKIVDLDSQIDEEIVYFLEKKHEIINQIHNLDNVFYIQILFKKYVEGKGLKVISKEIDLSYAHVRHLHGKALKVFEEMHTKLLNKKELIH
ncbi:MAG: hypothetical protein J6D02_09290 [Lachnospira sp.]|nr:hypothetical protein [Lachnospira sp.]